MRWYHYLSYFFGGAFLANVLPHLGNGISGHAFQSPFASPPGVGLSSSIVNVLWGLFNLATATCSSVEWAASICAKPRTCWPSGRAYCSMH